MNRIMSNFRNQIRYSGREAMNRRFMRNHANLMNNTAYKDAEMRRKQFFDALFDNPNMPPPPPSKLRGKAKGLYYAKQQRSRSDKLLEALLHFFSLQDISENILNDLPLQNPPDYFRRPQHLYSADLYKSLCSNERINKLLFKQCEQITRSENAVNTFRQNLPIYSLKEDIVKVIDENRAVIITGEAGCGKSTQIPQYILENWILDKVRGSECRILSAQPRRICATSLANRVSYECGNADQVGYHIRFDNCPPNRAEGGSIVFCTTGIALKYVEADPYLKAFSHIIVDEVHERALDTELLLIHLRRLLNHRNDVKLILCSASMQAEKFSSWLDAAPILHIPTRCHEVSTLFLEDIISDLNYFPSDYDSTSERDKGLEKYLKQFTLSHDDRTALLIHAYDKVSVNLVVAVVNLICHKDNSNGCILIFVPGWQDVSRIHDALKDKALHVLCLHSHIDSAIQNNVFKPAPDGLRKVVIATNIAESSITIVDVKWVVDCGLSKQNAYDSAIFTSLLQQRWISKANALQRKGRAGRVSNGVCICLYTNYHYRQMEEFPASQLVTCRLDTALLHIKNTGITNAVEFLSEAVDPPRNELVESSVEFLKIINALTDEGELTPLGVLLSRLPCDPQIGKLIIFGVVFSCLDPILTIASFLDVKDPFIFAPGKENEIDRVRKTFAYTQMGLHSSSDHLMFLRVYEEWCAMCRSSSAKYFCHSNFLSENTLRTIERVKAQLLQIVHTLNFVDMQHVDCNRNSDNADLISMVLCAGFYPNIAKAKIKGTPKGPVKLQTQFNGSITVSKQSICSNLKFIDLHTLYFTFFQKIKSSDTFIYDMSPVNPISLLFCAKNFKKDHSKPTIHDKCIYKLDNWLEVCAAEKDVAIISKLRVAFDNVIVNLLANPRPIDVRTSSPEAKVVNKIVSLFTR